MSERVNTKEGEKPIPQHRWHELNDLFTRIDDLVHLLNQQTDLTNSLLAEIVKLLPTLAQLPANGGGNGTNVIIPEIVTVRPLIKTNYAIYNIDLSKAHNSEPLKLGSGLKTAVSSVTVIKCDAPASWTRNSVSNPSEDLSVNYTIDEFQISELYITNVAAAAGDELKILVEWIE